MNTTNTNNRENMTAANTGASYNKIDDFGAKIGGARKDLYKAAREWADRLADITADKLAAAGLSKLVRLPNLESMTAAGAISAEQARAALALWRTIDRKPAGTYKADRWADRTRETLAAIAAILTAEDLAAVLSDDLAALPDYQVLTAANWPAEAFTFGRYQVRRRPAYYSNAGKLSIVGGRYFVGTSSDDPADIAAQLRTMTATDADRAAESRARGPKLGIYHTSDGTRYFIAVENKCEIVLKVCDTYREAAEAVKNDRAALLERYNALKSFPALRRSWNRPRVGKEWHAEDVTPEQFAAALPFRGVEFGNWLNQQERAALLNSAFDGFHDLADLLGIPAEAVALGGRLNFSFATRGTANSAAHFESLYNTINLNKRNGAGCMAHEWLHACDHYAAVLLGRGNCSSWGEAFATEYKGEAVTDADRAARELVAVIKTMDYYTRSRNYQRISGKQQGGEEYYIMPCELAARGFEGVCLYLLQSAGQCSDFLVNLQSWQDFERDDAGHRRDCYPYPSEAEAAALLPYYIKFFRALFGRCEVSKKAAEGVAAATLQATEEKAEADRLAAEKAEQEKKAAEAIRAARRAEQEQKAAEAKAKAEQTRAAIVDRLTAAHFDTIATGYDCASVYFAAHMQGEIFTGSVDIKTTEAEAVAAAQAAPLARVQYKRVHNAKRIICHRWKGAEIRANKYTAAEVLAELNGAEVRTIARTFADFEKAETWNDAAHLWDDTQRAHEEKAARARQTAQERTANNEPTDSKAESRKADSKAENGQGATISDPRAAGLQLVTIAEGVAVVGTAEDERTRGRQTWKARRDIKAHGCTWNRTAQQWEATTAEAVAAVRAWFGESDEQDASEGTTAPAAPAADIESQDNTATPLQDAGEISVKLCERIYNDTAAPVAIGDAVIYNKFKGETPRRAVVTGYDDTIKMYFLETEDGQNIATGRDGFAVCGPESSAEEPAESVAAATLQEAGEISDTESEPAAETLPEWATEGARVTILRNGEQLRGYITEIHKAFRGGHYLCTFHELGTLFNIPVSVSGCAPVEDPAAVLPEWLTVGAKVRTRGRYMMSARSNRPEWVEGEEMEITAISADFVELKSDTARESIATENAAAELTPVYYSNREESQAAESEPAAIAASDEQGAPVIESPKIEEIAADEMLKQWQTIKEKHPDALLLFRCGDYYELYQDDAEKAAELLGLTIQTTATGYKAAAFPYYDISEQLPRLIRAGHRVAICDKLEAPKLKTVARGCTEQTEDQADKSEQGAPMTAPNREGLPDWLHVGTRFCLLDFVTGEPTAVRYTCAAIDYEARTVTIPEAADAFRGGSHVYRWNAFHWNTFAPVTDDTDPMPDPSGEGDGVGTCHSYEQGAPCYSTSEKPQPTRNQAIAKVIVQQLGGNQFAMMTGAKQFVAIENGVRFRIGKNKTRANMVKITLRWDDTYNMEFWHIGQEVNPYTILMRYANKGLSAEEFNKQVKDATERAQKAAEPVKLKAYEGIYCDQLQELFTEYTELYTRLF